jgi:choline monooxygenase
MVNLFAIDPDIRRARTPPAALYLDSQMFAHQIERVLRPGWHLAPGSKGTNLAGRVTPFVLLPGVVDAPLVLTCAEDRKLRCLSNVCTHRANLVVEEAGAREGLRCRYHGRRFSLTGRFQSMPEFEGLEGFPSVEDDLPELELGQLGALTFVSLAPHVGFETWTQGVRDRTPEGSLSSLQFVSSRDYEVNAHWALYVENFLEGFHIPFVHADLNRAVDYDAYRTDLFSWGSVQIALSPEGEPAASYFWLFPSTMLNVYPWGVSVNAVVPLGIDRTRIHFETWSHDGAVTTSAASSDLDKVELEDEAIVENVQRGVRSPLYRRGRYSPKRETGVHHFHRLLAGALG